MNFLTRSACAFLIVLSMALVPLAGASHGPWHNSDGNYNEPNSAGHHNDNLNLGAGLLSRTFMIRWGSEIDGRYGWYSNDADDGWANECNNYMLDDRYKEYKEDIHDPLLEPQFVIPPIPDSLFGDDHDNRNYDGISYYYEYHRTVHKDVRGTQVSGQNVADPTGCGYVDRGESAGFGHGNENPCDDCRIGIDEDGTLATGIGFQFSALIATGGPFRSFQLEGERKASILACQLVILDPISGSPLRGGQIHGTTTSEGDDVVLVGDGLDPGVFGQDLEFGALQGPGNNPSEWADRGDGGRCKKILDQEDPAFRIREQVSANGPGMGTDGGTIITDQSAWVPDWSYVGVTCARMGMWFFDPVRDQQAYDESGGHVDSPYGWTKVYRSDYDWVTYPSHGDTDYYSWAYQSNHMSTVGYRDQGCAHFSKEDGDPGDGDLTDAAATT